MHVLVDQPKVLYFAVFFSLKTLLILFQWYLWTVNEIPDLPCITTENDELEDFTTQRLENVIIVGVAYLEEMS